MNDAAGSAPDADPTASETELAMRVALTEHHLNLMRAHPPGSRAHWSAAWNAVHALTRLARFADNSGLGEDGQTSFNDSLWVRPEVVDRYAEKFAKALNTP